MCVRVCRCVCLKREIKWQQQRAFSSKQGGGQGQIFNLKINNVSLVVLLKSYL